MAKRNSFAVCAEAIDHVRFADPLPGVRNLSKILPFTWQVEHKASSHLTAIILFACFVGFPFLLNIEQPNGTQDSCVSIGRLQLPRICMSQRLLEFGVQDVVSHGHLSR